jgi:hypothetical protein
MMRNDDEDDEDDEDDISCHFIPTSLISTLSCKQITDPMHSPSQHNQFSTPMKHLVAQHEEKTLMEELAAIQTLTLKGRHRAKPENHIEQLINIKYQKIESVLVCPLRHSSPNTSCLSHPDDNHSQRMKTKPNSTTTTFVLMIQSISATIAGCHNPRFQKGFIFKLFRPNTQIFFFSINDFHVVFIFFYFFFLKN